MNIPPHDYAGVQSIQDFVAGEEAKGLTPLALADLIERDVDAAEKTLKELGEVTDKELRLTIDDIKIVCEMGRYYADKIRGASYVALARESKDQDDKGKAVAALSQALNHNKVYVAYRGLRQRKGRPTTVPPSDDAGADVVCVLRGRVFLAKDHGSL